MTNKKRKERNIALACLAALIAFIVFGQLFPLIVTGVDILALLGAMVFVVATLLAGTFCGIRKTALWLAPTAFILSIVVARSFETRDAIETYEWYYADELDELVDRIQDREWRSLEDIQDSLVVESLREINVRGFVQADSLLVVSIVHWDPFTEYYLVRSEVLDSARIETNLRNEYGIYMSSFGRVTDDWYSLVLFYD